MVNKLMDKVKPTPKMETPKMQDYMFDGSSKSTMGYTGKAPAKPITSVK